MKKRTAIIFSVVFVLATTVLPFGVGVDEMATAAGTEKTEKKTTDQKELWQVSGEVTAIDTEAKSIMVNGITIIVDEKMLADIKVGDRVTVDYITKGMNTAISVMPEVE